MPIAIIGTGAVGSALARGLARAGHAIISGARNPEAPEIAALATETGAAAAHPADAARPAETVILALPWAAAEQAVAALGPLAGKIVVDCMNLLGSVDGQLGLLVGHESSGGEIVQGWLPGARVVKTLNQVGAEMMADAAALPRRPVMFLAGDDEAAKSVVAGLLGDLGFEALDAGDLRISRLLESFGMLRINQALLRGKGRRWALAAVAE